MFKNIKSFGNFYNVTLTILLATLLSSVFLIKGSAGVFAWTATKLIFAPIGLLLTLASLLFLIGGFVKNKRIFVRSISFILSGLLAFPTLLLFNVIPFAYPSSLDDTNPSLTIHSPFHEDVKIGWGGDTVESNVPHVIWSSERWAYDIVKEPSDIKSDVLADFGIYGLTIYVPVKGTVIAVYDAEDDIPPNTDEFISMAGNYVYLKVEETGTYLLMNHLLKDSVTLEVGDKVFVGDYLGKIGNSGSTSEPHLHIHHQRQDPTKTKFPVLAEGLPLYFYDNLNNEIMPVKGDTLQ